MYEIMLQEQILKLLMKHIFLSNFFNAHCSMYKKIRPFHNKGIKLLLFSDY